jgi:hypothetical protein
MTGWGVPGGGHGINSEERKDGETEKGLCGLKGGTRP